MVGLAMDKAAVWNELGGAGEVIGPLSSRLMPAKQTYAFNHWQCQLEAYALAVRGKYP